MRSKPDFESSISSSFLQITIHNLFTRVPFYVGLAMLTARGHGDLRGTYFVQIPTLSWRAGIVDEIADEQMTLLPMDLVPEALAGERGH